jgi:hypothetical protein
VLGFFPTFEREEIFFSAVARYRAIMGMGLAGCASALSLGRGSAGSPLPMMLGRFVDELPTGHPYTVEHLIDRHTLLPYYEPFLSAEDGSLIRALMAGSRRGRVNASLGLLSSSVSWRRRQPLFCATCAREDRGAGRLPFWRRVHQCPGMYLCPLHDEVLRKPAPSALRDQPPIVVAEAVKRSECLILPSRTPRGALLRIAEASLWLLENGANHSGVLSRDLEHKLWTLLEDGGWLRHRNSLATRRVAAALNQHFGAGVLSAMGCALDVRSNPWIVRLLRRGESRRSPLHYLLLLDLLQVPIAEFFAMKPGRAFGSESASAVAPLGIVHADTETELMRGLGCRNPFCPSPPGTHGREWQTAPTKTLAPGSTVKCASCGFVYRLVQNRSRWRILNTGRFWDEALIKFFSDPSLSDQTIRLRLGVSDKTLHQHAARLGVWRDRWGSQPSVGTRGTPRRKSGGEKRRKLLGKHRRRLTALYRAHPLASRFVLQKLAPASYEYLRVHDREWLGRALPEPAIHGQRAGEAGSTSREAEMLLRLKDFVAGQLESEDRPTRITVSAIGRELGIAIHSSYMRARMPRVAEVIAQVRESQLSFARRRLAWSVRRCRTQDLRPTFREFQKMVGSRLAWKGPFSSEVRQAYAGVTGSRRRSSSIN